MIKKTLSGLTTINLELTNRCNKNCWMCGRRKVEKEHPEISLKYGDMDFELVKKIVSQLPANIVIQLHNNGESLLYPKFGDVVKLLKNQITNVVSNGKLIVKKSDEIIGNLDTIAISVFENDPESDEQFEIIKEFLSIKKDKKPYTIFRLNGNIDSKKYESLGTIARRVLHSPMGSFNYKKNPTIPEIGICLDFLNHLAINVKGEASICVRFDPKRKGVIGNCNKETLIDIWNSEKRLNWLNYHRQGKRSEVPLCSYCEFWGVPTGYHYNNDKK